MSFSSLFSAGRTLAILLLMLLPLVGCSPKRIAINSVADMLTSGTSSLGSEDDPEFLLEAIPFALMGLESLAASAPEHVGTRAALASGFVQYAYAGADLEAELVKYEDYSRHLELRGQARKRYLRGKKWGLEGLELKHPGFVAMLAEGPEEATAELEKDDIDLIYWTGAGWLAAISISLDRADLLAQLPQATALLERALELDPDYDKGSLHEVFVALDMSRGEPVGGEASAKRHFDRALELSGGQRASTFVTYATSIAVKTQDYKAFTAMLDHALAIDLANAPEYRLANILAQRKAEYLKAHIEDLFDLPVEED